jgi:hypothetical protein
MSKIGEVYVLPAGTPVWSIQLQETVKFQRDVIVAITNTCHGNDHVFATKLVEFKNLALTHEAGRDMTSYMMTKNEIGVDFDKLKFIREYEFEDDKTE